MTPTEQKAFDQMREALEAVRPDYEHRGSDSLNQIDAALTAAASVSHPKPETTPAPEGGAITSESAANAVSAEPQAQGEASEYARGFSDGMNEAPTGDCWVRAIDEAMVGAHLGVADMSDDYGTAKEKLNTLICWHVEVAMDPQATEPAWRPIETAPKDGSEILLGHPDGSLTVGWWRARNPSQGWTDGDSYAMGWPTHWQPAPAAPEAKQ